MQRRTKTSATHPDVPSSNTPPVKEWAGHFWYVLRTAALQACDTLTDDAAQTLARGFEAMKVMLPCAECRGHYARDWDTLPFTLEHAKDPVLAMRWVEDLRLRIEARKTAERKESAAAQPALAAARKRALAIKASVIETRASQAGATRGCTNCRKVTVKPQI